MKRKKVNKKELLQNIIGWAIAALIIGWLAWQFTNPDLWI